MLFSERIRTLRKERGLLQRRLAEAIGVDVPMYSRYEHGERHPKRDQVVKLARLLDTDAGELVALWLAEEAMNEVKIREAEQSAVRFRENLRDAERASRKIVREAAVALEERRMERLRDEAELAGLDAEIARLMPLVEKKLVSELELTALRPKAEALRKTVGGYEPLLKALAARLEQAEADVKEIGEQIARYDAQPTTADGNSLSAALKRYEELQRADTSVLRALSDGVVSQVFRRAGDIVPAGEAIVRLASAPDARFVTGMLPAEFVDAVHVGDELVVSRLAVGRNQPVLSKGRIETIDPEVLDFFDPMNPAPRVPVRGRKVRIRLLDEAGTLIPGESVLITQGRPGTGFPQLTPGSAKTAHKAGAAAEEVGS